MRILPLCLVLFGLSCMDLDDSLFNPSRLSSYQLSTAVIPESAREFVKLNSQGKRIYGYFVRAWGPFSGWTVLYCHGNRDHLQFYWDRVEYLYKAGFNVFIFDYQGFGMSEGTPSESALYSDGQAALAYIRSRPDVSESSIVFYGFSLGNVVTIDLAARYFTPHSLIAEAPFASARSLVASGTLLDIPSQYVMKGEYNNAEKIKKVRSPLLVLHGERDKFIDIDKNGKVIYDNAPEPKRFVRVPGADHSEIPQKLGEGEYIRLLREFITRGVILGG